MDKIRHKWKLFVKFVLLYGRNEKMIDDVRVLYTKDAELTGGMCADMVKSCADDKLVEMGVAQEESVQSYVLAHLYRYCGIVNYEDDQKLPVDEENDRDVFIAMEKSEFAGARPAEMKEAHDKMWNNEDIKPPPELAKMTEQAMIKHCLGQAIKSIELSDQMYDLYANFIYKNSKKDVPDVIDTMIQVDKLQKVVSAEKDRLKTDDLIEMSKTIHNLLYYCWIRSEGRMCTIKSSIRLFADYIDEMSENTMKELTENPFNK